jgi:PAS domain S-box-containing protein
MPTYEKMTKAELIKQIKKLESQNRAAGAKPQSAFPSAERDHLVHELQVHQVELETQNEELRLAQKMLEESRDRYADLYDSSPMGYITLNAKGAIIEINLVGASMLGVERDKLIGMPFSLYVASSEIEKFHSYLWQCKRSIGQRVIELVFALKSHASIPVQLTSIAIHDTEGQGLVLRMAMQDITERRRTEAALRQSEADLAQAQRMAKIGNWRLDLAMGGMTWSDELYRIFAIDKTDPTITSESFLARIHPEDKPIVLEANSKTRETGESFEIEYRITTPSGQKHVHEIEHAIKDAAGNVVGLFGVVQDITNLKQAEELRQRKEELEQLLDLLPVVIWIAQDPSCQDIRGNRFANDLLGVPMQSGVSSSAKSTAAPAQIFYHDKELAPDEMPIQVAARTGQPQIGFELRFERPGTETVYLLGGAVPLFDKHGETRGAVGVFQNITEQKKAEVALRTSRDALSVANLELVRSAKLKDEFLANMSHELRTPLNSILGLTESLQEQFLGTLNEQQFKALTTVDMSGHRLLLIINEILDLSAIGAGTLKLNLVACAIKEISQASLLSVREEAQKKQIKTSFSCEAGVEWITADERRLKQMLVHLLNNAVKFTPAGGKVGLEVVGDAQNNVVQLTVWDTGIGIAKQDMPLLFQPFVQLDGGLNRRHEGTGLGLILVARIAEMHGGSVSVESELGQGSRFTITLPWLEAMRASPTAQTNEGNLAVAEANRPLPISHSVADAPLILIAEDNEWNITALSMFLEAAGYRIAIARHGGEALEMAKEIHPDVILMDIQMPVLDGLEVTRCLRQAANSEIASVPIIALTALAMPGDRERAIQAGANEYMSKPASLKQLVALIEQLIRVK